MSIHNQMAMGPPTGPEREMLDAKKILNDIILKWATLAIEDDEEDFEELPLNDQKRILGKYGLKQGLLSRAFHSVQKRLRLRSNNNSRTSTNFLKAKERYFNDLLNNKYDDMVSRIYNKNIKTILNFRDMYQSGSEMLEDPKGEIYNWLRNRSDEVSTWAMDTYFKDEPALRYQRAAQWQGIEMTLDEARRAQEKAKAQEEAMRRRIAAARAREEAKAQEEADPPTSRGLRAGFDYGVPTGGPKADAEASAAWAAEMALRNPPTTTTTPLRTGPPQQALWGASPGYSGGGGSRRKSQRRKRGRKARRTRRH